MLYMSENIHKIQPTRYEYALDEATLSERHADDATIRRLASTALTSAKHKDFLAYNNGELGPLPSIEAALESLVHTPTEIMAHYGSVFLKTDVRVLAYGHMRYSQPPPQPNKLFAMLESVTHSRKQRTTASTVGVELHEKGYVLSSKNQLGPHALALALQTTSSFTSRNAHEQSNIDYMA